jgi:hypothetical protein
VYWLCIIYPLRTDGINPVRANRESGGILSILSSLQANIFQDSVETLIMKFPFPYAVCLLLALITILAGCTSSPSSPGTITLPSGSTPVVYGTPVRYTELSQLVLSPAEIPFMVVAEKNQTPDMKDPTFSRFGAIRGYTQYYINEQVMSPTSVQLGQTIVEYPPGNAVLALAEFEKENRNADQSRYKITMFEIVPVIGDQSRAVVVTDSTDSTKTIAMIVFTKSDIMESVVMIAQNPDTDALTRAARQAAAKIP